MRCFLACGGLTSVEHWACPRLWSLFVVASLCSRVFLIWFLFVGGVHGGCLWWRLQSVRRVSLCFFFFIPHDREVVTHCSCSAESSHFFKYTGARVEGWHDGVSSHGANQVFVSIGPVATRVEPDLSHLPLHQMHKQLHLQGHPPLFDTGTSA